MDKEKNNKPKKTSKKLNLKISIQEIIIIILLISFIFIFYAYKHDIEQHQNITKQYKDIVENPQRLCYQYYEYLNQQTINQQRGNQNLSELLRNMFVDNSNDKER